MEELIDILDENGNKTGNIATRHEVHTKGLWHKVIVVAIINEDGKLLMQQRSKNVETYPEKWDVSTAGHVSAGQTSIEAAMRELSEEIGMRVNKNEIEYVLTYKNTKNLENYIDNQFFDFYIVKKEKINIEKITMQKSEVQQVKLCNLKEVQEMILNKQVVRRDAVYEKLSEYLK